MVVIGYTICATQTAIVSSLSSSSMLYHEFHRHPTSASTMEQRKLSRRSRLCQRDPKRVVCDNVKRAFYDFGRLSPGAGNKDMLSARLQSSLQEYLIFINGLIE
nr:hypothetical protein CFP56_60185 [Quercus suber]